MTIWKYPLEVTLVNEIELPPTHTFVSLGRDAVDELSIWFLVDETQEEREKIKIYCAGTGMFITPIVRKIKPKFLGTIVDGIYVWHYFADERDMVRL